MLSALKKDLHLDEKFITRLLRFDKETLAYGLLQYRYRWSFAEGRIVLISGELRKLGIFPALAALMYAIQHAENPTRSHLMPITSPPSA
jgi:hypothetical protein